MKTKLALAALTLSLAPEWLTRADALINAQTVVGPRYPAGAQVEVDTEEF